MSLRSCREGPATPVFSLLGMRTQCSRWMDFIQRQLVEALEVQPSGEEVRGHIPAGSPLLLLPELSGGTWSGDPGWESDRLNGPVEPGALCFCRCECAGDE